MKRPMLMAALFLSSSLALAGGPELLKQYEAQARQQNPAFTAASAPRGRAFYATEHPHSSGEKRSCATCHTANPRGSGQTRAGKPIEPMAPVANAQRFTDPAKVEKWFSRNCSDVLERACTPQEKADFLAYMLSIR